MRSLFRIRDLFLPPKAPARSPANEEPALESSMLEEQLALERSLLEEQRRYRAAHSRARAERRREEHAILAANPDHPTVEHIVDDRTFLLGLDALYRESMKYHESAELLSCAQAVAARLGVSPTDVPIEGYYGETRRLTAYFRLMRALQEVSSNRGPEVQDMPEFERVVAVLSSPIYGRAESPAGRLLPSGRDPLTAALEETDPSQWTIPNLLERAYRTALGSDDFSLVGLAALARDAVVVAGLRESVVLYASMALASAPPPAVPPIDVYIWRVDDRLARRAARFVSTFNQLFDEELPAPVAENADLFFENASEDGLVGRCVRIATTLPSFEPSRFYHWAVYRGPDGKLAVEDLWDTTVWTTKRYREHRR